MQQTTIPFDRKQALFFAAPAWPRARCRAIYDAERAFCGRQTEPKCSYCAEHHRAFFTTIKTTKE